MPDSLRLDAPAKLNLGLIILARRPDGYHDLLSVFQAISWTDTIALAPSSDGAIHLTCTDPDLPSGPENLVWRAAELVRRAFDVSCGVTIHLEKRIPSGAGLGGGSSDAATTMRGLAHLWGIEASEATWLDLCAQIGSDVPFFWHSGTAIVEGRGERVTPLPTQEPLTFVVAVPPVHVSSAWAYRQLAPPFPDASEYRARVKALRRGDMPLSEFCRKLDNTFQPIVEQHYPEVRETRERLLALGATTALMSGSGSAVFGVFSDAGDARQAVDRLRDATIVRLSRLCTSLPDRLSSLSWWTRLSQRSIFCERRRENRTASMGT